MSYVRPYSTARTVKPYGTYVPYGSTTVYCTVVLRYLVHVEYAFQVGPKIAEHRACTPGDAENFAISRVIA